MYDLRPESVKTFVSDRTIKLPRFQRNQTWGPVKNFNLCLSLFKDFPLGVVVLRVETHRSAGRNPRHVLDKYLIDGRQRRNALSLMGNPEQIYDWAKSALKLRFSQSREDVIDRYWRYVDEYFGQDEELESSDPADAAELDPEDAVLNAPEPAGDGAGLGAGEGLEGDSPPDEGGGEGEVAAGSTPMSVGASASAERDGAAPGLTELLGVILSVHPRSTASSLMTKSFDLRRFGLAPEILKVDPATDRGVVDSGKLIDWIRFKRGTVGAPAPFPQNVEEFIGWVSPPAGLDAALRRRLARELERRWSRIEAVFSALDSIERRLQESKIGYLELRDCTPNDERKIFVIINSEGTELTAAEILSAKPAWNKAVDHATEELVRDRDALYAAAGIAPQDPVVRWDVGATLIRRVKTPLILGGL